ncbi:hypothetical protein Tsubulata_041931 [Turnera subulata]|uniref:Uncharacterized protein n=1 Tax=Turnera subulata TaxID=218843 RepID=A0A9Q0GJ09_9ROSI|nr:hypothetical protein Tsubulata_041931 [Turnera subulata]
MVPISPLSFVLELAKWGVMGSLAGYSYLMYKEGSELYQVHLEETKKVEEISKKVEEILGRKIGEKHRKALENKE